MINRRSLLVIERVLVLLAAFCLMLAPLACNSGFFPTNCDALTARIRQIIAEGGIGPGEDASCRFAELVLESLDAGCPIVMRPREELVQEVETECGG